MEKKPNLIDRDALLAQYSHPDELIYTFDVMDRIREAPAADAVPVVRGRWEHSHYNGFLRCSNCRDVYVAEEWIDDGKWSFCPNCGAKMDLEDK